MTMMDGGVCMWKKIGFDTNDVFFCVRVKDGHDESKRKGRVKEE